MKVGITLISSLEVGQEYIDLTVSVARILAKQKMGIVYGGTAYGMMLTLAESYTNADGKHLTGVMAKDLMQVTKGYMAYDKLDDSYLEDTIEERKRRIIELSDAFLILPGGYGTLEEIGSIVGGKVNKLFDKPIAVLNFQGFYDKLIDFLTEMYMKKFTKISVEEVMFISQHMDEVVDYFHNYQKQELVDKFV